MNKKRISVMGSNFTMHYIALNDDPNLNRTDREVFGVVEMFCRMIYGYCFLETTEIIELCKLDLNLSTFKKSLQTLETHGFLYRNTISKPSGGKARRIYVTYNPTNDTVFNPIPGVLNQKPRPRVLTTKQDQDNILQSQILLDALNRNAFDQEGMKAKEIASNQPSGQPKSWPSVEPEFRPSLGIENRPSLVKNKTERIRQQNKTISDGSFFSQNGFELSETDLTPQPEKKIVEVVNQNQSFQQEKKNNNPHLLKMVPPPDFETGDDEPDNTEIDWNAIALEVSQTTTQLDGIDVEAIIRTEPQKQVIQPLLFADDTNTSLKQPTVSKGLKSGNKEKLTKDQVAEAFELFLVAYKRRDGKAAALKAFEKVVNGALPKNVDSRDLFVELIVEAAKETHTAYMKGRDKDDDLKFMKYPASWLNQQMFIDYIDKQDNKQAPTTTQIKTVYVASNIDDLTDYYGNKDYD